MARSLLDTNILIYREAPVVVRQNIGLVFNWLDRLGYEKCIHPLSVAEIERHGNEKVRSAFTAKLASYRQLRSTAPISAEVDKVVAKIDTNENDRVDTAILNEVYSNRVDLLITEDKKIRRKAALLGIEDRVFSIDSFLEKAISENPDLIDYRVLSVERTVFGRIDVSEQFFDNFRTDYPGFDKWFHRKCDEDVYICREGGQIAAFLYLKVEDEREPYPDIVPIFRPKRRLKIGTFKVVLNGFKLGERFLKIVFDNAVRQKVDEVYVTIFPRSIDQLRLIDLLEDFGFTLHGEKANSYGNESVYIRSMGSAFDSTDPRKTFPYIGQDQRRFLVPIYPEYHTSLLPDSILRNESPKDYIEHEPHRNAIQKMYISRSHFRDLRRGDTIVFYRTGGFYKSVVTTLGIVQNVYRNIPSEDAFIRICRKRSVFSDDELRKHWRHFPNNRPFVVEFLYAYSFPRRPNLAQLIDHGIIKDVQSAPRGFEGITDEQFRTTLRLAGYNPRIIVN